MLPKRPLLDIAADQQLFVADGSRRRALQAAFQHRNTLIVGEAGSGKTTLLHQIRGNANRMSSPPRVLLVDARLADDARDLVDLILREAEDAEWVAPSERPSADDPFGLAFQVRRLRDAPEGSVILIDDPDAEQAASLFGRLRDELWQLPVWFTAAVRPPVWAYLNQPPADAFFDVTITLEPLGASDASELLRRRKHNGQLAEPIREPSRAMQPRAILLDAEQGPTGARYDGHLQTRLMNLAENEVGRAGAMLLAEIWGRGAVSASDATLQQALGVSRNRLTQMLKELERAGVLISYTGIPAGTPGRPKTMYDINSGSK